MASSTPKAPRVPGVVQRPWVATSFPLTLQSIIFCFCSVGRLSLWTKLLLMRSIGLPLSIFNCKPYFLPPICKLPRTTMCVAQVVIKAAAAAARSFSFVGALHRVVLGGPMLGFEEGPFTPLSCCLFLTALLGPLTGSSFVMWFIATNFQIFCGCWISAKSLLWTFCVFFWHFWQFWMYCSTSFLIPSHVQFSLILNKVAFIPGCLASL